MSEILFGFFLSLQRHKNLKQRAGVPPGQPPAAGQAPQPPTKHKTAEKPDKAEKQQKRPQTPFHHRNSTCEEVALEPDASGQRLALRGAPDGAASTARFPGLRPSEMGAVSKPPQLHGGAVGGGAAGAAGGGGSGPGGGPPELAGSPQPPPLSPHPCERSVEEPGEALKNPSTPHSQHFYPVPPSSSSGGSEPCLLPQKGASDEPRMESLSAAPPPPFHAGVAAYPEPLEPVVYVGAAVSLEEEACGGAGGAGGTAPWRFFNLPRRKDGSEFPTPALPGDKLREEAALGADGTVSVTE